MGSQGLSSPEPHVVRSQLSLVLHGGVDLACGTTRSGSKDAKRGARRQPLRRSPEPRRQGSKAWARGCLLQGNLSRAWRRIPRCTGPCQGPLLLWATRGEGPRFKRRGWLRPPIWESSVSSAVICCLAKDSVLPSPGPQHRNSCPLRALMAPEIRQHLLQAEQGAPPRQTDGSRSPYL